MHRRTMYSTTILCAFLFLKVLSLPVASQTPRKSELLAEVEGEAITAEEVENALGAPLAKLQEEIHNMKRQKLETLIGEKLLSREAAKRGISVRALLGAEVTAKVGLVTEQEIETFYQANKARLHGEEASLREQIRAKLQDQKVASQRVAFIKYLRSQAKVVLHLSAPTVFRAAVSGEGAPFRGPADAPVTIVEFSDFHCPYCKKVEPVLSQLLSRYGDKVKLVYRNFPIDSLHPMARKAAEAGQCANEQGKFWAYHNKLYASGPDASPGKLRALAGEVGLDLSAFELCLSTRKYQATVEKDVEDGTRLGVTGTPGFFINGRMLSGAQPLENFVRVIDQELARPR